MDVKELARMGGLASAKKRFSGKSKKQISQLMSKVRKRKNYGKRKKKSNNN
jgi:hypothetical protein